MDKKFKIGDVVYVSGNVRYKDAVGEVVDLSRNADFVVVKLYGVDGGNRSFHASDLTAETEEQAEKREEKQEDEEIEIYFAFYNEEDHKGWVGKIRKSEVDGRTKWREVRLKGEDSDRDWGNSTYMSYLSPGDLMTWVEKDYGRQYDVRGPFESRDEARQFMKKKFMLDESVITEAHKFKPGDPVHMGFAVKNGSGVDGTLDKIEGDYAFVKVKKGNKEELVKGHAAYLSKQLKEAQTYTKTADWKDGGKTYKRWDLYHPEQGNKADRHISSIELHKDKDQKETYKAHHRIDKGYWTSRAEKELPVKVTHRSTHGTFDDAKNALEDHAKKLYAKKVKEGLEDLEGLNLATCDLLEAWIAIEQLYDEDEALLIFEALKEVRSQLNEGYGESNKDFQDWIKAVRKKHPNATLTGSEQQAQMIDWTTTNNALCGEWDGKKGTILEGVIGESEFLQRMLKHVSDKRNFRNTNTGLDDAAIADAKKASKGQKSFDGINYKNDVGLMKDLLARGKRTAKKEKDLAKQYDQYNKQEEKGKTPKLPVGIKKYQDYISKGKSIRGGRVVNYSTSGFSDEDADDGGDGRLMPTNLAIKSTLEHFHNFLHHMAEEELLSCKVIHIEAEGDQVVFYAECRDDPRSEGFQKDLSDKLQARLNRHTFPGVGVVNCKVIHINPPKDKIAK